jgi:hypothetical protein
MEFDASPDQNLLSSETATEFSAMISDQGCARRPDVHVKVGTVSRPRCETTSASFRLGRDRHIVYKATNHLTCS